MRWTGLLVTLTIRVAWAYPSADLPQLDGHSWPLKSSLVSSIVGPSSIKGRRVMFGRMSRRRFLVPAGTFSFAKYVRSAGSFFGLALPKGTSRAPP